MDKEVDSYEKFVLRAILSRYSEFKFLIPYLKPEYFKSDERRKLFREIAKYAVKYKKIPSNEELATECKDYDPETFSEIYTPLDTSTSTEYLTDSLEKWLKHRALAQSIVESARIFDGTVKNRNVTEIPDILRKALSISFNSNLGHDYFKDWQRRFDYYSGKNTGGIIKIPFGLREFDKSTNGGFETKTLNCIGAGSGVGKTLYLCDLSAKQLKAGHNVLYISAEISEDKIGQRIDANLLDIEMKDLKNIPETSFKNGMITLQSQTKGKLYIKEYPAGCVHAGMVNNLIEELAQKHDFVPLIVCLDYIGIMASQNVKRDKSTYEYIKNVAEESRSIAQEKNMAFWTATQFNRKGYTSSDPGMEDTSDSFGLPMTLDYYIGMTEMPGQQTVNQYAVKQLGKNRYEDKSILPRWTVGVDRPKMRLYDVQQQPSSNFIP